VNQKKLISIIITTTGCDVTPSTVECGEITVKDCDAPSWCTSVISGQTTVPTVGQCKFYKSLGSSIQVGVGGKLCINNECKTAYEGWYNSLPAQLDGGYYVYCQTATCINNNQLGGTSGTPACGGGTSSAASSSSSSSSSSANTSVTATCTLIDRNNNPTTSLTVTQGENIKAPKVTCSNNTSASISSFNASGSVGLPTDAAGNWPNNGNAYYNVDQGPGKSGTSNSVSTTISVNATCSGTYISDICGTITVQRATCTHPGGDYTLPSSGGNVSVPAPTPNCGNATYTTGSAKYNVTGEKDNTTISSSLNWNNNPPTSHGFGSTGDGRVIRMYEIECDGHKLEYASNSSKSTITCGTISIKSASSTQTCDYNTAWCNNKYSNAKSVSTSSTISGDACFFVSDISKLHGYKDIKINGTTPTANWDNGNQFVCGQWVAQPAGSCANLLPAKKDGGYYIYTGSWLGNGAGVNEFVSASSPPCNW